ncbi:MAG: VWA domain-containing protein [Verrucomicrobia bacterium]|nr:VWA domain-containing protein [Verrucomicrobiota bacterium]
MTFGEPSWLIALLLVPALWLCMWRGDVIVRRRLGRLVAARLRSRLVEDVSNLRRWSKRMCLLAALAALALTLARPQWGYTERPVTRHGRDLLLAVDTSRSMLAADVTPNRLTRAKLAAEDIIRAMRGDRIGLIAFAGEAQMEAPLTTDETTLHSTLALFDTNTVDRGGTDFEAAIRAAIQAFGKSEQGYRALVLITDGEELEGDGLVAARQAAKLGIRIFTVGVGSPDGSTITLPSGTPLRDRSGTIVVSRLDEDGLRAIAEATGGFYTRLNATSMHRVINDGLSRITQRRGDEHAFRTPIEHFQIPLAIGIGLLLGSFLISDRRPAPLKSTVVVAGRKIPVVASATAVLMASLLVVMASTPLEFYQRGDYQRAFEAFQEELQRRPEDPLLNFNAGDAGYRLGKYQQAFEGFAKAMNSPDPILRQHAYYNAGNTLFKEGDLQEDAEGKLTRYYDAQYQYEQALELDPGDAAARKNLEILKRRIKEAEEQKKRQEQAQKNAAQRPGRKGQSGRQHGRPEPGSKQGAQPSAPSSPDDADANGGSDANDPENSSGDKPDAEATPTQKKEGDLREHGQGDEQNPATPAPNEELPGKMSADEARGLLDSLRGDEDRVDLNRHKRDRPVLKDW